MSTILSVWPLHLLSEKIKIDLQHLWQLGIAWDEELSTKVRDKLIKSFHEVTELNQVSFPRHLCAKEQASFCVFSDNQVSFPRRLCARSKHHCASFLTRPKRPLGPVHTFGKREGMASTRSQPHYSQI